MKLKSIAESLFLEHDAFVGGAGELQEKEFLRLVRHIKATIPIILSSLRRQKYDTVVHWLEHLSKICADTAQDLKKHPSLQHKNFDQEAFARSVHEE